MESKIRWNNIIKVIKDNNEIEEKPLSDTQSKIKNLDTKENSVKEDILNNDLSGLNINK